DTIGSRPAGSEAESRASVYLAGLFGEMGLCVDIQRFHFLNWMPLEVPVLNVLEPVAMKIPCAPMAFTLATSPSGIEGDVLKIGEALLQFGNIRRQKYTLVHEGEEVAFFLKGGNEEASTFPSGSPFVQMPGVIVGARDVERYVEPWLSGTQKVRMRLTNRCVQEMASSQNVIAYMGEGAPKIVICAHYDGVYNSPSANDNASGVEMLFRLARKLIKISRTPDFPGVAFICFGCEELKFNGSSHYVRNLQEHNALESIEYVVNLDMVAAGNEIAIGAGNGMEVFVEKVRKEMGGDIKSRIIVEGVKPTSDHWAFHESGIATAEFTCWPYAYYHQVTDSLDRLDPMMMRETEMLAFALVKQLLKEVTK
ncbi:M28 family metallopeptidase, partial [Synergistaceae bacterium OttesenSCG-928-I11]|nr:M28 family metallopeptidase [Synergistaceae bacterium OttesenSCG-928-I11]